MEYGKSLKNYQGSTGDVPVFGTNGPIGFTTEPLCMFPSVIVGRKGAYRGVHYSDRPFFVIDTAFYLRPKTDEIDLLFAYYQLLTQNINLMDSGSAIPSTSREDFYSLEINLPPLPTQRRIAAILSALDQKIELNRQTNATLEAIAQAIFKEWFIDFRFPGATGETRDSELGPIPKGWKTRRLGEIMAVQNGYAFKSSDFMDAGDAGIIKIKNIGNKLVDVSNTQFVCKGVVENLDVNFKIDQGSLLIAMTGAEVGKIGMVPDSDTPLWLNQRVGMFRERVDHANHFLYILLGFEEYQDILRNSALGSAQPNISATTIENIAVVLPPNDLIGDYGVITHDIFKRILSNVGESATLSSIRDGLLPKLINGDIEV